MKKINEDINNAIEKCLDAITIAELSIRTGVKVETLKRFVSRRAKYEKNEVFQKIYPEIRSYILLKDADESEMKPVRIGDAPRTGHYLDELNSDEKVLIDTFSALPEEREDFYLKNWGALITVDRLPDLEFKEFNKEENRILAIFRGLDDEIREAKLLELVEEATNEMKNRRIGI